MFLDFLHSLSCSFHVSSILLSFSFRVFSFSFLLGDTSFHFQQISCQFLLTSLSFSANVLSVPVHFSFIFSPFHPRFWKWYVWFSSGSGGFLAFCPQGLRHLLLRLLVSCPLISFIFFHVLFTLLPFSFHLPFASFHFPLLCDMSVHFQPISSQILVISPVCLVFKW